MVLCWILLKRSLWGGFCSAMVMFCYTVTLGHSSTQPSLQSAGSVPVEPLCCWKCLWRRWTCSSVYHCGTHCHYHTHTQSTPVLFQQVVLSSGYSSLNQWVNTQKHHRTGSILGPAVWSQSFADWAELDNRHLWKQIRSIHAKKIKDMNEGWLILKIWVTHTRH